MKKPCKEQDNNWELKQLKMGSTELGCGIDQRSLTTTLTIQPSARGQLYRISFYVLYIYLRSSSKKTKKTEGI